MPLVKPTGALITLFLRYIGRNVEFDVIDAFHFELRREIKVVYWNLAATEDVYLRLCVYGWSIGETVDSHAVLMQQDWISTVGKTASLFIWIEAIKHSAFYEL